MTKSHGAAQSRLEDFELDEESESCPPTEFGRFPPEIGTEQSTGITELDVAGRVGDIHVIGVLHKNHLAIARVSGAITRYDPDVVAMEASGEAVRQYHQDICDPRWPSSNEVEAAAFASHHREGLALAGISTKESTIEADFEQYDREIFTELGVIDSEDQLTKSTYYHLDLPTIRKWRELTERRDPEAFQQVLSDRDDVMAGHLIALYEQDAVDTIVAVVGIQHLTGVLDRLRDPDRIPAELIDHPPWQDYTVYASTLLKESIDELGGLPVKDPPSAQVKPS